MIRFENSRGEKNRNAKFTRRQIEEILARHKAGEPPRSIVKDFDTTVGYIYQLTKKGATRWR